MAMRAGHQFQLLSRILACPYCWAPLAVDGDALRCTSTACARMLPIMDDVILVEDRNRNRSFFDGTFGLMSETTHQPGTRKVFYMPQSKWLEASLDEYLRRGRGDAVLVDVGCGPSVPYTRRPRNVLVGVTRATSFSGTRCFFFNAWHGIRFGTCIRRWTCFFGQIGLCANYR